MLSLDLGQFCLDPQEILKDESNYRLLAALTRFARLLEKSQYSVRVYSEAALQKLPQVSPETKAQITANFELWSEWIEPLDPSTSYENEILLLERALNKYGFQADPQFMKTLEKGQIVEFYGEDMVQLYRSFNFFLITGYSLLDISLFEWYVLWDRPKTILQNIGAELTESLEKYIPVKRFEAPKHIIREIYNSTNADPFVPRLALAEFLHLGSLRSTTFSKHPKKGFICSSFGQLLPVGEAAENVRYL